MDADEIAAKELKERKGFSLSASIGERVVAGRERCRIGSLNNQL